MCRSSLSGKDTLCLLQTGFGKSMCMILPTLLQSENGSITIIISPLLSLIDDQILTFRRHYLKYIKITSLSDMTSEDMHDLRNGNVSFVFACPESILHPHWKDIFLSDIWQKNDRLLAIDEAHCI